MSIGLNEDPDSGGSTSQRILEGFARPSSMSRLQSDGGLDRHIDIHS